MTIRNCITRTSLTVLTTSVLFASSSFAASFYGNFSRGLDLNMSAGQTTTGSFDLNALGSLIAGYDVDFSKANHEITNISLSFNYSRAPINGEHTYTLDEDSVYRYAQSAGPALVEHDGQTYFYEVIFSENRTYRSDLDDGQTVSATVNGSDMQGDFIGHIDYQNSTEHNIPEGTEGVIETTQIYSNYVGPVDFGSLGSPYYYYPPMPGISDLETYDFSFTSDNGNLVLDNVYMNFNFNSVQEVPVPAAAWLFGSALLGLFQIKRRTA